jgi:phosphoadenosine phosphosulfate reductase
MQAYLAEHGLPDERVYFDPTKVEGDRECGLHPNLFAGKGR